MDGTPKRPPVDGPIVTLANMTDGNSTTVIFSEYVKRRAVLQKGEWEIMVDPISDTDVRSTPGTSRTVVIKAVNSTCQSATRLHTLGRGGYWIDQRPRYGGGYSQLQPPNRFACIYRDVNNHERINQVGASSYHSGGVNVCPLDDSVRFIRDGVDPATWHAIATRAGAEIVDAAY